MMKLVLAAAFAATVGVPAAAAESLVQRSDWQERHFDSYLPRGMATVPWLELDLKTRLPKGDILLGRNVATGAGFVLPLHADVQVSTNSLANSGSM